MTVGVEEEDVKKDLEGQNTEVGKELVEEMDIYSLLGLSENEISMVENKKDSDGDGDCDRPPVTISSPPPPSSGSQKVSEKCVTSTGQEKEELTEKKSRVVSKQEDESDVATSSAVKLEEKKEEFVNSPDLSKIETDDVDVERQSFEVDTISPEEEEEVFSHHTLNEEDEEGIKKREQEKELMLMRNARYVDAHKKRMEVAAKKRKPKVKKLPPAADYKSILAANNNRRKKEGSSSSSRLLPRPPISAPIQKEKTINRIGRKVKKKPLAPFIEEVERDENDDDDVKNSSEKNDEYVSPQNVVEIQVKQHEEDINNQFEMLLVLHDDDKEGGDDHFQHNANPAVGNNRVNQLERLRNVQLQNERFMEEINMISASSTKDDDRVALLELEALDTIHDTLATALSVCNQSLCESHVTPARSYYQQQLDELESERRKRKEELLEEKKDLLLNWKMEEQKRVVEAEVSSIELQLKEKVKLQQDHLLQVKLEEKKLELMGIVEEMRQRELVRLQEQKEKRRIAVEREKRKKERQEAMAEQKALNQRINSFLECQEEELRRVKERRMEEGIIPQEHQSPPESDWEWRDDYHHRSPTNGRQEKRRSGPATKVRASRNPIYNHDGGQMKMKTPRDGDYFDSEVVNMRKERNEYYRAKNAEKDRSNLEARREIQERMDPAQFGQQPQRGHRKQKIPAGKKIKKIAPSTDYSQMLSRNRKARQIAANKDISPKKGKPRTRAERHYHHHHPNNGVENDGQQSWNNPSVSMQQIPRQPLTYMPQTSSDPFQLFHQNMTTVYGGNSAIPFTTSQQQMFAAAQQRLRMAEQNLAQNDNLSLFNQHSAPPYGHVGQSNLILSPQVQTQGMTTIHQPQGNVATNNTVPDAASIQSLQMISESHTDPGRHDVNWNRAIQGVVQTAVSDLSSIPPLRAPPPDDSKPASLRRSTVQAGHNSEGSKSLVPAPPASNRRRSTGESRRTQRNKKQGDISEKRKEEKEVEDILLQSMTDIKQKLCKSQN